MGVEFLWHNAAARAGKMRLANTKNTPANCTDIVIVSAKTR